MPAKRFYLNNPLLISSSVVLSEEEFHHLAHVMRLQKGDIVELVNGQGTLAKASIDAINRSQATLQIMATHTTSPLAYEMALVQAIPKQGKWEWILEKSVELGATNIYFFPGKFSEKTTLSPSQQVRASHILLSSMKQCGRLHLPTLSFLPPILHWKQSLFQGHIFFGDPSATTHIKQLLPVQTEASITMIIGPEQGWSKAEVLHLENVIQARKVLLHENILRTETAAICSLSIISQFGHFVCK